MGAGVEMGDGMYVHINKHDIEATVNALVSESHGISSLWSHIACVKLNDAECHVSAKPYEHQFL